MATDFYDKPLPRKAWVVLFQETTPEKGSGRRVGRYRFPTRRPPAVHAREASHRACANNGRRLAFPRRPANPAGVKNCVTRSERGGHLRLQGTSAEHTSAKEELCASAPKTVTGNFHLTGEASPSSPEVWRFCVAGRRRSRQKLLSVFWYPDARQSAGSL